MTRAGVIAASARRRTGPPIVDDFTTLDTTKWAGATYGVSVVDGRLRVPCSSTYPQAATVQILNLTAYNVWVQVPTVPTPGNGSKQVQFLLTDGTNNAGFNVTGNPQSVALQLTGQDNTTVTYDSTAQQWLRYSIDSGNLLWQASPDNVTWSTLRTIAAPAWMTGGLVAAVLASNYWGTEDEGTYAEFDNFCVPA